MRNGIFFFILFLTILFCSCRADFEFQENTQALRFSKDTVYLDTVFSNVGSSTYRLKVYNQSNQNIRVAQIKLAQGNASQYRLNVDGKAGKIIDNVEILAKDSIFIFIETTIDYTQYANPTAQFLYTDQIEFISAQQTQKVPLVTLVKDAYFLFPKKYANGTTETLPIDNQSIYGFFLDENDPTNGNELHFTNQKPYVIYGYAAVPSAKTLQIDAGAKIYFHANSGIIVAQNGAINAQGSFSNPITFEGDRLEPEFENLPGQWGAIWLTLGSNGNFQNTQIKNATVGLLIEKNQNTLTLNNLQIYNCSNYGILAKTATINATNTLINNAGKAALALSLGGHYTFSHSTIANYWPQPNHSTLYIDNGDGSNAFALQKADFNNCIFYGNTNYAINLNPKTNSNFQFQFNHSLIKFYDNGQFANTTWYNFTNTNLYTNCLIAKNNNLLPYFKNPTRNQLEISNQSAAKGKANFTFSANTTDANNQPRTNPSDIGAYNFKNF